MRPLTKPSSIVFTLAILGTVIIHGPAAAEEYYVDCSQRVNGNGTRYSPWNSVWVVNVGQNSQPFQPGDSILFKRGTSCTLSAPPSPQSSSSNAALEISHSSGQSGQPITIGAYGNGPKPIIEQNGNLDIIRLSNKSYITIENLHLTGDGLVPTNNRGRRGIYVVANSSNVTGITISNVTIENIIGEDKNLPEEVPEFYFIIKMKTTRNLLIS